MTPAAACWLILLAQAAPHAANPLAPKYSSESITNAASNTVGPLSPNTLISIYGENLSFNTRALSVEDIRVNTLPTMLTGTGVRVLIANLPANLLYVSPTQINLLIPSNLLPGRHNLEVIRDGLIAPPVEVVIEPESPQFFVQILPNDGGTYAIATQPDGSVVEPAHPAEPGDLIIIYATGLGTANPPVPYGQIATGAAWIKKRKEFKLYLNDMELDSGAIEYAGVTPGNGGLYQINVKLPKDAPENPQIRMGIGAPTSVEGVRLAIMPESSSEASQDLGALQ